MPQNPFPGYYWYPSDWFGSSAKATMTVEQQGAYRNLLDFAWRADPPCSLPNDPVVLAKLSDLGDRWPGNAPVILRWFTLKGERYVNERQLAEFKKLMTIRKAKKAGGQRGGRKSAEGRAKRLKHSSRTPQAEGVAESKLSVSVTVSPPSKPPTVAEWFDGEFVPAYPEALQTVQLASARRLVLGKLRPSPEKRAQIMVHLAAWKETRKWADGFGVGLKNFFDNGLHERLPVAETGGLFGRPAHRMGSEYDEQGKAKGAVI